MLQLNQLKKPDAITIMQQWHVQSNVTHNTSVVSKCMCASYPCAVLNAVYVELHGDVEAMEEVSSKHQCVLWSVYSMDPP